MTIDRLTSRDGLERGATLTSGKLQNIRDAHAGTQEPFNVLTGEKEGGLYDLGSADNRWRDAYLSGTVYQGKPPEPESPVTVSGDGSISNINYRPNVSMATVTFGYLHTTTPSNTTEITVVAPWDWSGGEVCFDYSNTIPTEWVTADRDATFSWQAYWEALNNTGYSDNLARAFIQGDETDADRNQDNIDWFSQSTSPFKAVTENTLIIDPSGLNNQFTLALPLNMKIIFKR